MRSFTSFLSLLALASAVVAQNQLDNDDDNNGGNSNGGNSGGSSSQGGDNSLTLDQNLLCTGCQQDGQNANGTEANQVASLTSNNNFINFCGDSDQSQLPVTNGIQITSGSCNPVPMGVIAAVDKMPAAKFQNPKNFDTIQSNQDFTVQMAIQNLETGNFVNPDSNYFAAPCQANSAGQLIGHSHVTIQNVNGLSDTNIADPQQFAFFKGLNDAAVNGVLSVDVTGGLPAGTYRLASINSCANHQAVAAAVAQRGSHDDMVYFTVSDGGNNGGNTGGNTGGDDNGDDGNDDNGNNDSAQVAQQQAQQAQQQAQQQQQQAQQQQQQAQQQQQQAQQQQQQQDQQNGNDRRSVVVEPTDAEARLLKARSSSRIGTKFQGKNKRLIKRRLSLEKF